MVAGQLSIGEVLAQLQREFPDVTISKIRFLESQGLINPERTPSGYRKFSEADLTALRWILVQQRDHFLPLRVIKERLERGEHEAPAPAPPTLQPMPDDPSERAALLGNSGQSGNTGDVADQPDQPDPVAADESPSLDGQVGESPVADTPVPHDDGLPEPHTSLELDATTVSMTIEELSAASGLSVVELRELETFRLLVASPDDRYDGQSLVVARAAKGFAEYGVEARHLRMYLTAAEREATMYEQAALPAGRQRGPEVARQTREAIEDLVRLGDRLRGAMLREALAEHLR